MISLDENPNEEEKEEKLDEDYDRPAAPPSDIPRQGALPRDDPAYDTDVDEDEWYSEGGPSAAGRDTTEKSPKKKT